MRNRDQKCHPRNYVRKPPPRVRSANRRHLYPCIRIPKVKIEIRQTFSRKEYLVFLLRGGKVQAVIVPLTSGCSGFRYKKNAYKAARRFNRENLSHRAKIYYQKYPSGVNKPELCIYTQGVEE